MFLTRVRCQREQGPKPPARRDRKQPGLGGNRMVLKKSPPKHHERSPKQRPPLPPETPPEMLEPAIAAVAHMMAAGERSKSKAATAPTCVIPEPVHRCLEALSNRTLPKRLATLPTQLTDTLVKEHAAKMKARSEKCAGLLIAKYAMLEENKLGTKLVNDPVVDDTPFALMCCTRKTPRFLWMQQASHRHIKLSEIFESALSTSKLCPATLDLDLDTAGCSRELQLHYKDENERRVITELHARAQDDINQVNDFTLELLRIQFEKAADEARPITLSTLAAEYETAPLPEMDALVRMHAALIASTDPQGAVQSFYPITDEERERLEDAVNYVLHAPDYGTAHTALYMWMVCRAQPTSLSA